MEPLRNGVMLITGGSGFVGTWLGTLVAYLNDRHNFGIDLTLTARSKARFATNAPHLAKRKDVRFAVSDIRQLFTVPGETRWIIHSAANPDSREHSTNPMETMAVIGDGTNRVLRSAEQCVDLRMILHLSSALVYGAQPVDRSSLPEDYVGRVDTTSAVSAYAEAKRYSEVLCASARSQSRLPVAIARPFTFLGPFQSIDAPWALNNFIHAAMHGQALKVLGDGSTKRSYLYGSDAAFLLLSILSGAKSSDVYNVGHSEATTLVDLAKLVLEENGQPLEVRFNTGRGAVPASHLIPDMTRAERDFGFKPATPLRDAIRRTISWNRTGERVPA
jgi:dTDP-glucose 4,6-dehydratase